ncbi:MAG: SH3 domain-containing protein, partial [Clostridia bacterium]|nr:SH3 domain-containing protein [Clostridia bacterium]
LYVPPVKSEPGPEPEPAPDPEPKPAKNQKTGKAANKKPIIGIVAAVLAVAAGIILIPKAVKNTNAKKETAETTSPTIEAESISETVAEILTEITTQITKKETTTAKETTAKETTTKLDLSKLPSAYITTKEAGSGVYLRKSANEDAKTPELLKRGTEVKIIDKQGDWYKVAVNGKTGYIKSEYISYKKVYPFGVGYVEGRVYYNDWANIKCSFLDGGNTTGGEDDCNGEIGQIMFSTRNSNNDLRVFIGYKKCNINDAVSINYNTSPYNSVIAGRQCICYDGKFTGNLLSNSFYYRDCYVQVDDYTVIFRLVSVNNKESLDDLQNMIQKLN